MAAAAPSRRINQSTFNEAVAENIEEFEMEFEEAVNDAKEQFSGEGVDISDLVSDDLGSAIGPEILAAGGAELLAAIRAFRHPVERALTSLSAMGSGEGAFSNATEVEEAKTAFAAVVALLSDKPGSTEETEAKKARIQVTRDRCVDHGLIPAVCSLLDRTAHTCKGFQSRRPSTTKDDDDEPQTSTAAIGADAISTAADGGEAAPSSEVPAAVLSAACGALEQGFVALRRLCYKSDRARRQVLTPAVDACLVGLKHWEVCPSGAAAAGRCAGVVATKAEGFKRRLHAGNAVGMAMALMAAQDTDTEAVRGGCAVLRAITAKDDPAATMAEGLEHAKVIAADGKTVPLLVGALAKACGLIAGHEPAWARASDLMLGLRALHINNEMCNALLDSGAVAKVILRGMSAAMERFNAMLTAAIAEGKAEEKKKATKATAGEEEAEANAKEKAGEAAEASTAAVEQKAAVAAKVAAEEADAADAAVAEGEEESGSEEEEGLKRVVRVGLTLLKALCNSDAVKRAMVNTVLAAGGAGAAAGADWMGGGSRAAIGLPETSAAAGATSAAASAVVAAAGDAGLEGPVVGMLLMLRALHVFRYHVDVSDQALSALSNSVLRVRENAKFFVDNGGAQAVLTMMRRYPWHPLVQRHGALVLRNAVSWDKSLIPAIVAAGAEPLLRAALAKHSAVAGEATRAALRDLVLD